MTNLIDQYTTGAFVLTVDGHDLKIKPLQGDKLKIHALDKKLSRLIKDKSEEADTKIEETMEKKTNILKEAIKRADSTYKEEHIDHMLMSKQSEIEEELGVSFGWYTKAQLKQMREKKDELLAKADKEDDKEK
jgi:hypothetical protein